MGESVLEYLWFGVTFLVRRHEACCLRLYPCIVYRGIHEANKLNACVLVALIYSLSCCIVIVFYLIWRFMMGDEITENIVTICNAVINILLISYCKHFKILHPGSSFISIMYIIYLKHIYSYTIYWLNMAVATKRCKCDSAQRFTVAFAAFCRTVAFAAFCRTVAFAAFSNCIKVDCLANLL